MNEPSIKPPRHTRSEPPWPDPTSHDVLCYMDQGSFVGLRALGRHPVLHFTWLYSQLLDESALNEFNHRMAQGFLGRLLQRSPWPWGRHRWVACPVPAPITWCLTPIPVERLSECRAVLAELPLDPEHGPGWRLAVQSLEGGGCALSILVSHTLADGKAATQAMADAVAGRGVVCGFSMPSRRWSLSRMGHDFVQTLHALPSTCRALAALIKQARSVARPVSRSPSHAQQTRCAEPESAMVLPLIQVVLDSGVSEERACDLGVKLNTLLAAFSARLAFRMGRVDADGRVRLAVPVSTRQPGDLRGNALSSVTVMADPQACISNPRALQEDLKAALTSLRQNGDDSFLMLPLVPYVPLRLVRQLERVALGADLPVGCSILGELPSELSQICGEGELLQFSSLERFTASELEMLDGKLVLLFCSLGGRLIISVLGYKPRQVVTRAELMPFVKAALLDLGLVGSLS